MKAGLLSCGLALGLPVLAGILVTQDAEKPLEPDALKTMIEGLGYEVKVLSAEAGKEKFEFLVKTDAFNVPMAAEITPSKNYIWLTANLGKSGEKANYEGLMKANGIVQPVQFYVTKSGTLMVGLPIENHGVTPAWMKKGVEKVAADVSSQASVWQNGE